MDWRGDVFKLRSSLLAHIMRIREEKMVPVKFKQQNVIYAENQPEYLPLPAHKDIKDSNGTVTSCWRFSILERIQILFMGKIYWQQLTFDSTLQPHRPSIKNPLKAMEGKWCPGG